MQYIFYGTISALILFGILIFMRKIHWDAVHHNLLDLADELNGEVIRSGFASRPVFHAKYNDHDIAINISTERTNGKRQHAVDITIGCQSDKSITISSKNWLRAQNTPVAEDYITLGSEQLAGYSMRFAGKKNPLNSKDRESLDNHINDLIPFNFLFIGASGILFETAYNNVAMGTKHPVLKNRIDHLIALNESIKS